MGRKICGVPIHVRGATRVRLRDVCFTTFSNVAICNGQMDYKYHRCILTIAYQVELFTASHPNKQLSERKKHARLRVGCLHHTGIMMMDTLKSLYRTHQPLLATENVQTRLVGSTPHVSPNNS